MNIFLGLSPGLSKGLMQGEDLKFKLHGVSASEVCSRYMRAVV